LFFAELADKWPDFHMNMNHLDSLGVRLLISNPRVA
jgi:hypothetical protein